ncbi:hypothetical protein [uncultured Rhodospira sp.]|uniref:hypothetical protein n=1 Tax=uncultured Rhodospira sp. TaxID=1936189 RepID=UPI00261D43E6|nr:hypothetical protein [uncultured Rhodospira sp.]
MEPETRSFDAAQWKAYRGSLADDSPRPAMAAQVKALLERRTPTRKDVVALLGRPDEQTPEALYYVLGRSDLSVSFDYLGIYFDPDQRVSRVVRTHR